MSDLSHNARELFRELADPRNVGLVDKLHNRDAVGHAMAFLVEYLNYSRPSPELLRTLYQMLGMVPGVADAGWTTDRAGRRGVAIAVPLGPKGARQSFRLIVDTRTGQLLDIEDVDLDRSALDVKPPYVSSYEVYSTPKLVHHLGEQR